jgi:very-long-chain enoyl-CoA reductase
MHAACAMAPRAHNLISYSLALLVFAAVLVFRLHFVDSAAHQLEPAALLAVAMWCTHFARRASESAWVHRYGKASVPISDVVTEYVYYWGFAAWNAVSLTSPAYRGPVTWLIGAGLVVFVLAEAGNARAHRMLRDLRPAGSKLRVIPRGFLFESISSPHYLFEILSWVGFALVTQTWAARAFLVVGAGILGAWAHTRHAAYRKDFDGQEGREKYPAGRRALIPGIF